MSGSVRQCVTKLCMCKQIGVAQHLAGVVSEVSSVELELHCLFWLTSGCFQVDSVASIMKS